jgi:hypothetical protein
VPVQDLLDVPVVRGPIAAVRAHGLGARAFTSDGVVYLPDDVGALDGVEGRAVLAHEMAHVVQQRILGGDLPDEASPHGQELEAQAAAVERAARTIPSGHPMFGSPAGPASVIASWSAPGPATQASPPVQRLPVTGTDPATEERSEPPEQAGPSMEEIRDELGRRPPRRWVNIDAVQDLEELANLLYDRLHHRLRTDVLVQRERSGLLMDYR